MYYLGHLYNKNHEGRDSREALKWFEKSAELGNSRAWYNIGRLYQGDSEIDYDFEKARKYFEKGAKRKHSTAMYYLGKDMYEGSGGHDFKRRGV